MPPQIAAGETLDRLSGAWWIFQLERGHRYNTDDVLVAWTAVAARPEALTLLDLGAGVGSIGLMTLQLLPGDARLTAVEVQARSVALARKTLSHNGIEDRVELIHADLREVPPLAGARFELITGNPPYLTPGMGPEPAHPQKAAARFELHGDIFDYCRVAAERLSPEGHFCFCYAAGDERPEQAIAEAGLHPRARREVHFREGHPPRLVLFDCALQAGPCEALSPLSVRNADGQRSEAYQQVLRDVSILA